MNKTTAFIVFMAAFTILWNVLDFLYAALLSGDRYQFAAESDLAAPIVIAAVIGYVLFLRNTD